ncbi:LytTR family DNA-binding domain-containing protein [Pollutibacter soli]|uniref:LytR/AlgR family response regulator transcription factor n=1 Tax=Pollutibacter soli TaxID=3034157 RepID=UPI003014121A
MLKAIVVDDEPMALEVVRAFTEKVVFVDVKGYFTNGFEALDFLRIHDIDLIFLDIHMPDLTGIEMIRSLPKSPMVIFTTAYSEHAVESFELNAIDYLLKPYSMSRFLKACNKAYDHFKLKQHPSGVPIPEDYIFIKDGYEQVRVDLNEIRYAEGNGNYIDFVLENKKVTSRLTMNEAEALLPENAFVRIHRSYIISKKFIRKLTKKSIWIGQAEIPVGAAYVDDLENLLK